MGSRWGYAMVAGAVAAITGATMTVMSPTEARGAPPIPPVTEVASADCPSRTAGAIVRFPPGGRVPQLLEDATHVNAGATGVHVSADGMLVVTFAGPLTPIQTAWAVPDETLARVVTAMGPSVGERTVSIRLTRLVLRGASVGHEDVGADDPAIYLPGGNIFLGVVSRGCAAPPGGR